MNKNLDAAIKNLKPGESKKVNIDFANINGKTVIVRISPELSSDEIFERAITKTSSKVIPFQAGGDTITPEIRGSINLEALKTKKSKFALLKKSIASKVAQYKKFLKTPEQDLDYYVDELGRKYEINEDDYHVYFDDSRPNLEFSYYLMVDEFGTTWEYTVLEGGVIGKFLNSERTIIEVDGVAYNFGLEGIDYDHPLNFPTRH